MHAPDGQHPSPDNGRPVLFLVRSRPPKERAGRLALLEIVSTFAFLLFDEALRRFFA
jgi:hypothetical protein